MEKWKVGIVAGTFILWRISLPVMAASVSFIKRDICIYNYIYVQLNCNMHSSQEREKE